MTMTAGDWKTLVAAWRGSRQTARDFARAHGVTDSALRYWAGRLGDEASREASTSRQRLPERTAAAAASPARRPASAPSLARVVRPGEGPPTLVGGRVLVVLGKAMLVVEPGFDAAHLRDVVHALTGET